MKLIYLVLIMLLSASTIYAQKAKKATSKTTSKAPSTSPNPTAPSPAPTPEAKSKTLLAEVSNIGGYPAFFLCDPVLSYKVVATKGAGINWTSAWTGGIINPSIADKAAKMVKRLAEDCKDEKIEFDAVIYSSGKEVSAIKFNNPEEAKLKLAKPKKIAGLYVFMFSEPHEVKFKSASESGGGIKWKSLLTGGLINNSIEEDFAKMVRKVAEEATDKQLKVDGVIYNSGKSVDGIIFE